MIFEDGLWMRTERAEKLADARRRGLRAELHLFDHTFDQLWAQLDERNELGLTGAVRIERDELERIWSVFEVPDAAELAQFDAHYRHGARSQSDA